MPSAHPLPRKHSRQWKFGYAQKQKPPDNWGRTGGFLVAIGGNDGRLPEHRKGDIGADHTLTNSQTLYRPARSTDLTIPYPCR
jgi:hypothetical protein